MGNRAVIAFEGSKTGIYLHWNGGESSVRAFLDSAKELGVRSDSYGVARLAQIIGNFFGGSLSVGVGALDSLDCDNYDNGLFLVGKDWQIVGREYNQHAEPFDADYYAGVYDEVMAKNYPLFRGEDYRKAVEKQPFTMGA
jgi:hypothetical protein